MLKPQKQGRRLKLAGFLFYEEKLVNIVDVKYHVFLCHDAVNPSSQTYTYASVVTMHPPILEHIIIHIFFFPFFWTNAHFSFYLSVSNISKRSKTCFKLIDR